MEVVHGMFKDSVATGSEVSTVEPGNSAIHTIAIAWALAEEPWRRYGGFLEAIFGKEIIVDFAWVKDVRLRLSAVNYATPDDGRIDVQCVCRPELSETLVIRITYEIKLVETHQSPPFFPVHNAHLLRPIRLVMQAVHSHKGMVQTYTLMHDPYLTVSNGCDRK